MHGTINPSALGILYAEDFGLDTAAPAAPPPEPPPPEPPPPPALTQADIDSACVRAVQAAERAWSHSAAERRAEALASLAAGLAAADEAARQHADNVAEELARTMLGLLAGALPALCRTHGDPEVRAAVRQVAPLLARKAGLVVRAHAGLLDALAADLSTLDEDIVANIELRPANLPPGDVRMSWENGGLVRDSAAICATLNDTLAQFGLTPIGPTPIGADRMPSTPTLTGSFAHAQ